MKLLLVTAGFIMLAISFGLVPATGILLITVAQEWD